MQRTITVTNGLIIITQMLCEKWEMRCLRPVDIKIAMGCEEAMNTQSPGHALYHEKASVSLYA